MIKTKKGAFGFGALIQKIRNYFTNYNFITRWFGVHGSLWYFLGIQVFFIDCIPSSFPRQGWRLSRFRFIPETFLRFQWNKNIIVNPNNGHHLYDADKFGEKEKALCKELKLETVEAEEHRSLYLYSPWIIDSWYNHSSPDQRVVVEVDGNEEIETHKFDGGVRRRKLPWWNSYRVKERWTNDVTEFDRAVDRHVTGGDIDHWCNDGRDEPEGVN